jgi:hypothetical protein
MAYTRMDTQHTYLVGFDLRHSNDTERVCFRVLVNVYHRQATIHWNPLGGLSVKVVHGSRSSSNRSLTTAWWID